MSEVIAAFFEEFLGTELAVFLISMLPIVELRGAIPAGAIFRLPFYENYILSVIGNMLPIPFILLFIPKTLDFLARFRLFRPMVLWLRKKANKHSGKVLGDAAAEASVSEEELLNCSYDASKLKMTGGIFTALMLFVAIPLPGTGAWTGSLVASLFNLPKKWSFLAVFLGVLIAGVIMCLASYGVVGFLKIFV